MRWTSAFLLVTVSVAVLTAGCSHRSTPFSNPFLSPDRVPPPATSMPAPGTAAPYYDNSQQIAPPVIDPGSTGLGGSGTYSPGASSTPVNMSPNATASNRGNGALYGTAITPDVRPGVTRAIATTPRTATSERGILIPTDDQTTRLLVRPAAAVVPEPVNIAPPTASPARHLRPDDRWLRPGLSTGATSSGMPLARSVGVTPPVLQPAAAAPAIYYPPPTYPASTFHMPPVCVESAPGFVSEGGCPPCGGTYFAAGPQTIEISELPLVQSPLGQSATARAGGSRSRSSSGRRSGGWERPSIARRDERSHASRVRVASAERPSDRDQLLRSAADATPRTWARYGHTTRYDRLKGRLEHSISTGQWKLRYIPIDGATDEFGGSVVLENPHELGDLAAGDFVEIGGKLRAQQAQDLSYAASYRIASVRPLPD